MNVLSQVMFGRYCPCDNNALVHNCHNANELYHNYHCLSRVLLLLIVMVGLVCISDHESPCRGPVSDIRSLRPLVTAMAGLEICWRNDRPQSCSQQ